MQQTQTDSVLSENNEVQSLELNSLYEDFKLKTSESLLLCIGPLKLAIHHELNEWSLAYSWTFDDEQAEPCYIRGTNTDFTDIDENTRRFADASRTDILKIRPKLADRSIVTRPRTPFYLVARQCLSLYVSSPVWLSVCIGESMTELIEIPIHRPSDTWFGLNTIEGDIAYATRTHARLSLDEIVYSRHRAITPVNLINDTGSHLFLERFSLPAPLLNLYIDENQHLWSSAVTLMKSEDSEVTSVKIESGEPEQVKNVKMLSTPRIEAQRNVFVKTIRALIG